MTNLETSTTQASSPPLQLSRPIREDLLAGAMACISQRVDQWQRAEWYRSGAPAARPETTDVFVATVEQLVAEIEDGEPFCDHSVGICQCDTRGVLAELRLWLDSKETCPECHGDGFHWNEEKYEQAEGLEIAGYENCPRCAGKGVVVL